MLPILSLREESSVVLVLTHTRATVVHRGRVNLSVPDPAQCCSIASPGGHTVTRSGVAPPCGTGLSAALKLRYAGLPPPGFHP
jgi:hypothetical protein